VSYYRRRLDNLLIGRIQSDQHGSSDVRDKIVELLSGTVNGCLSELGYFPGMQEQFQHLLQANAHLQNDNMKLYEDNRALARAVAIQNDRLAFSAGEDNIKLKQLADMKDKIESLSTELKQTNERLTATPGDQGYEKLYAHSQMLQARNGALERDVACFRNSYLSLFNLAAANGLVDARKVPPGQPPIQQTRWENGTRLLRLLAFMHPCLYLK
jgi:hypothetical protein